MSDIKETKSKIIRKYMCGGGKTLTDVKHYYCFKMSNGELHLIEFNKQEYKDGNAYNLCVERLHNKIIIMIINYDKSKKIITEQEILESENHKTATQSKLLDNENLELEKRKKYRENVFGLKAPKGRIIVSIDLDYKNWVGLAGVGNLKLERDVENLDRKYTAPTNAFVIDAKNIPVGAELIVNHNCDHDTNRIFSVDEDIDVPNIHYYSITETDAYIWRLGEDEWKPCENFALGLRVFEPYNGIIEGVLPTELKDTIFITSDCDIKGKVVRTLNASLYEMCFNDSNVKEQRIIRIRHSENTNYDRDEVILIDLEKTEMVENGLLLVGLNNKNCK